jgi:hypothetical protein
MNIDAINMARNGSLATRYSHACLLVVDVTGYSGGRMSAASEILAKKEMPLGSRITADFKNLRQI